MPIVEVACDCRRAEAGSLRGNPSCSMAALILAGVSGEAPGSPLTTRDTVLMLTPHSAATSLIVGRRNAVLASSPWVNVGPPGRIISAASLPVNDLPARSLLSLLASNFANFWSQIGHDP